jgi:hypothetical protein
VRVAHDGGMETNGTTTYEILVRLPADGRETVRLTARSIEGAKARAAELHGVGYADTQLLAIIDGKPQDFLAW